MDVDLLTVTWSLPVATGALVASALVIMAAGSVLAGVADRVADRTGLGEAITGALLLGAATSLPGLIVSGVAASAGEPSLAVSNSVGGIAVQTAFVVALDVAYGRPNIEHAAASLTNLFNSLLMMTLLLLPSLLMLRQMLLLITVLMEGATQKRLKWLQQ